MNDSNLVNWNQPRGLWKQRGASNVCIQIGLGIIEGTSLESNTDRLGYNVWHYWANSPNPELIFDKVLLIAKKSEESIMSKNGEHCLHFLIARNKLEALRLWLDKFKIPKEAKDATNTIAHSVAWSGNSKMIDLLGKKSFSGINNFDKNGQTPLIIAIHRGNEEFVQRILMLGADPTIKDINGKDAATHAIQHNSVTLDSILEDFGATIKTKRGQNFDLTPSLLKEHWDLRFSQYFNF